MSAWALRWRADASGVVAKFAGQVAGTCTAFEAADEIRRDMPNGSQIEIVPALSATPEGEQDA